MFNQIQIDMETWQNSGQAVQLQPENINGWLKWLWRWWSVN